MQICPACGYNNVELAIFCGNPQCRALLRRDEAAATSKGRARAPNGPVAASERSAPNLTAGPTSGPPVTPDLTAGPISDPPVTPDLTAGPMSGISPDNAALMAGEGNGGRLSADAGGDIPAGVSASDGGDGSSREGEGEPSRDETQDKEPATAQPASTPAFAAVRPGARPRPPAPPRVAPPAGGGAGGDDGGDEGDTTSGAEAEVPPTDVLRAERARFLAVKPGGTRPAPEVRAAGIEVPQIGVTLSLSPMEANVEPGGEASFEVLVRNTGTIVDQFAIQVTGDAARWVYVDPSSVNLYPDSDAAVVTLRFSAPHSPFTPAGPARFEVRAVSGENSNISAAGRGVVNVAPFYALSAALVPHSSEGRRHADHRLTVANQGNTRVNATLTAGDPDSRLRFNLNPSAITADPGTEVASEVRVRPRKPLWLGNPVLRPFEVTGTAEGVTPVKAEGQFQHIPLIPRWVPKVAILVVPLLIALVAYLVKTAPLPGVSGFTLAAARTTLMNAGFKPDKVSPVPNGDVQKDLVIDAEAAKGPGFLGRVWKTTPVTVLQSKGVEVPNVGSEMTAAATALEAKGFKVAASPEIVANEAPAGTVIGSKPGAQQFASRGDPVTLLVSSGIPTLAVNPTSLTMPSQPVGSSGDPQAVTIANSGTGPLNIASVVPGGANASDFTVTSNTCSIVKAKQNCVVLVTFTPGGAGPRAGALNITSDVTTGAPPVTLTGTGLTAEIGVGAANLNFEPQKVGTDSTAQTVTVTNKGSAPMTMREATVTGANFKDFVLTDGCKGNTVGPGANCAVSVVFSPGARGTSSGKLILPNAAGNSQSVALTGKGTVPEAAVNPLLVGLSNTSSDVITLTNVGEAPMSVGTAVIRNSDKFHVTNNECPNELGPKQACKITVRWDAQAIDTGQKTEDTCWKAALVIPTDDPVRREVAVGLTGNATLAQALAGLKLPVCGI